MLRKLSRSQRRARALLEQNLDESPGSRTIGTRLVLAAAGAAGAWRPARWGRPGRRLGRGALARIVLATCAMPTRRRAPWFGGLSSARGFSARIVDHHSDPSSLFTRTM